MEEKMYYTYIVASRIHNFYIGITSGIEVRVQQHKEGRFEGYSKQYNCNRLVWFERHPFVHDAIARDEFASLNKLPHIHTVVTESRKSGNSVVLGFQGRSQLEKRYGKGPKVDGIPWGCTTEGGE